MKRNNEKRNRRAPRGQAMVEYSVVSHALLIGTGVTFLFAYRVFIDAVNAYFQGIYAVLSASTI